MKEGTEETRKQKALFLVLEELDPKTIQFQKIEPENRLSKKLATKNVFLIRKLKTRELPSKITENR